MLLCPGASVGPATPPRLDLRKHRLSDSLNVKLTQSSVSLECLTHSSSSATTRFRRSFPKKSNPFLRQSKFFTALLSHSMFMLLSPVETTGPIAPPRLDLRKHRLSDSLNVKLTQSSVSLQCLTHSSSSATTRFRRSFPQKSNPFLRQSKLFTALLSPH